MGDEANECIEAVAWEMTKRIVTEENSEKFSGKGARDHWLHLFVQCRMACFTTDIKKITDRTPEEMK